MLVLVVDNDVGVVVDDAAAVVVTVVVAVTLLVPSTRLSTHVLSIYLPSVFFSNSPLCRAITVLGFQWGVVGFSVVGEGEYSLLRLRYLFISLHRCGHCHDQMMMMIIIVVVCVIVSSSFSWQAKSVRLHG